MLGSSKLANAQLNLHFCKLRRKKDRKLEERENANHANEEKKIRERTLIMQVKKKKRKGKGKKENPHKGPFSLFEIHYCHFKIYLFLGKSSKIIIIKLHHPW